MQSQFLAPGRWRFLLLLAALLVLLVVEPLSASIVIIQPLFDILLVVVMAVLALGLVRHKAWRTIAVALCLPVTALTLGGYLMPDAHQIVSLSLGHAVAAIFFLIAVGMIVAAIMSGEQSLDTIFGAICGYLLIGVAWGMAYVVVFTVDANSFELSDVVREQMVDDHEIRSTFMYYSYVTLSTVGYGDLTPTSNVARTLSWLEAVTGQVYMAVVIAGLVSAMVASKMSASQSRKAP
ncbi:potassium channel family protein [Aeoliella sp.]|uniref:potassium channel family protein n=1 Tax=Aeoliella sp. TaxID=2795800 RepID=UPI003CCBB15E